MDRQDHSQNVYNSSSKQGHKMYIIVQVNKDTKCI